MKTNTVLSTKDPTESTPSHFLNFKHIIYKGNKTLQISQEKNHKETGVKCYSQLPLSSLCCFESPLYTLTKVKSLGNSR